MAKGARDYMVKLNGTKYLVDARAYGEGPAQALALKTSEGDPKYGDMSHLSSYVQSDWRGGRAEDRTESGNRFYDSHGVMSWTRGQVGLHQRRHFYGLSGDGRFIPSSADWVYYLAATTLAAAADTPNFVYSKLSQSFTIAASQAVTECCILLNTRPAEVLPDTATSLTLRIETNSAGSPSGTLVHANATATATPTVTPIPGWVKFTFAGSFTLTLSTTYHLVLSGSGTDTNPQWAYEDVASSGGGGALRYDGATWTTVGASARRFYILGEVSDLPSYMTGGVAKQTPYFAVGTGLYATSGTNMAGVKTDFANAITDSDLLDSVVWIATGKGNNAWTMDASEVFAEQSGITGQLFYTFDGYLYRANGNDLYYYDGSTWSAALEVGDDSYDITGLVGLNKTLLIAKPDGLWGYTSGLWTYNIVRWESQLDSNNGVGMSVWNGAVYIPVQYGLVKYDGNTFVSMGPDQDEGLPNGRIGRIVTLIPLLNFMVAVVDAVGASDYSSVLLYNGHGWHEVDRSWWAGARIRGAVYDWNSDYLWYGMGNHIIRARLYDRSDNPLSFQPSYLEDAGMLETSWISGGLLDVWKIPSEFWGNMALLTSTSDFYTGTTENMRVMVDFQCDRSGLWMNGGSATSILRSGGKVINLKVASSITATTVSSIDAAGVVTVASIGEITKGDWVKIGNETRQVKSISGSTFTPNAPYEFAAAGDTVDDGYPTAREVKFRIRFHAQGSTPLMRAMRFSYTNQLTAWWRWSLRIKIGDKMLLPNNQRDTRTAATIRTGLKELATETNQLVDFVDIYDASYKTQLVKMEITPVSYSEDGGVEVESMAQVELVEV